MGRDLPDKRQKRLLQGALRRNELFAALYSEIEDLGSYQQPVSESQIIDAFERTEVKKGDCLSVQGEDIDQFCVIEKGNFDVLVTENERVPTRFGMISNATTKRTATLGIGNSCGERAMMETTKAGMTVRAATDGVVWRLKRDDFETAWLKRRHRKEALRWRRRVLRVVEQHSFFRHLQNEDIRIRVVNSFFRVNFREGETVIHQNSKGDNFYIIDKGELDVYRVNTESGNRLIHVKTLKPGESIGEIAIKFPHRISDIRVVAKSPVSLFAMERSKFQEFSKTGAHVMYERFQQYSSLSDARGEPLMSIDDFLRCQRDGRAFKEAGLPINVSAGKIGRRISANNREAATGKFENVPKADRGSTYSLLHLLFRVAAKGRAEARLIDFHDFYHINILMQKPNSEYEIAFKIMDIDGTGRINRTEFAVMLKTILDSRGMPSDDERIQSLIDNTVPQGVWQGRGYLSYEDFVQLLSQSQLPGLIDDFCFKIREEADTWYWQNRPAKNAYSSRNASTKKEAKKIRQLRGVKRTLDFAAAGIAGTAAAFLLAAFPHGMYSNSFNYFVEKPAPGSGVLSHALRRGLARAAQMSIFTYASNQWGKQTDFLTYASSITLCGVSGIAADVVVRPTDFLKPAPGTLPALLSTGPRWAIHCACFDALKVVSGYSATSENKLKNYGILTGCGVISSLVGSGITFPLAAAAGNNTVSSGLLLRHFPAACVRTVPIVTATLLGYTFLSERFDVSSKFTNLQRRVELE
jgi:CRP-like cAMP-binding protein/Ca2+-binding EF-hand superfamily protein